ncbi:uncharacterized protein LOC128572667 isoform X1 [Nycticebus coucang]|uniref:uncharacterized protein LOC128572667 isoform X1 n=1 Tax=Nycticebus coucang TaxID=9470 RepID=UPI00234DA476|nr:uncharacterized protein LOC128572667 isoform X1 [Nycticebus coucang]
MQGPENSDRLRWAQDYPQIPDFFVLLLGRDLSKLYTEIPFSPENNSLQMKVLHEHSWCMSLQYLEDEDEWPEERNIQCVSKIVKLVIWKSVRRRKSLTLHPELHPLLKKSSCAHLGDSTLCRNHVSVRVKQKSFQGYSFWNLPMHLQSSLLPRLKCHGIRLAHTNLKLLASNNPAASASKVCESNGVHHNPQGHSLFPPAMGGALCTERS